MRNHFSQWLSSQLEDLICELGFSWQSSLLTVILFLFLPFLSPLAVYILTVSYGVGTLQPEYRHARFLKWLHIAISCWRWVTSQVPTANKAMSSTEINLGELSKYKVAPCTFKSIKPGTPSLSSGAEFDSFTFCAGNIQPLEPVHSRVLLQLEKLTVLNAILSPLLFWIFWSFQSFCGEYYMQPELLTFISSLCVTPQVLDKSC